VRIVLAALTASCGLALASLGLAGTGWLAAAQLFTGTFAAVLGTFGIFGARRLRTCASCGGPPTVASARLPLDDADDLITAVELADPDRIARIDRPHPGLPTLRLELLHCPRCRDLGWLRATARVGDVPVRVGSTWVLLGSFLRDVLGEMTRRRRPISR